jgi:hypothetical protein
LGAHNSVLTIYYKVSFSPKGHQVLCLCKRKEKKNISCTFIIARVEQMEITRRALKLSDEKIGFGGAPASNRRCSKVAQTSPE